MHDESSHENRDLILTLVTVAGTVVAALATWVVPWPAAVWGGLVLAYLAGGLPAGIGALRALIRDGEIDIDLLMVVAALAAAAVGAAIEGAVLLTLFSISGTLEARAMGRARRAVEALMALRPDTALLHTPDGSVREVAADTLAQGDLVVLRPGARVPVDAVLVSGAGSIDESTITGESMPVAKEAGAKLHEATVNIDGVLTIRVARPRAESTVARMIQMVTEAQAAKAPSERFSQWFGRRYTVAVLAGSVLALVVLLALGLDWDTALYRAATLLVAASPCAVVISVPAAILSALSAAARGGVLFKGGAALEDLAQVRSFAFDKTGTLTTGRADLTGLFVPDGNEDAALALLAGIEAHSEHPIAEAIRRATAERGVAPLVFDDMYNTASEGIAGRDGDCVVWAGNLRMLARRGITLPDDMAHLVQSDETTVFFGRDDRLVGAATVADTPRETSAAALVALRESDTGIALMTGDKRAVALRVGAALGLRPDEIHADLLPEDKVRLVSDMAGKGAVAFVGDGVNDAAALARADVGIAMGAAGSDVALAAADVAFLSEDMTRLAEARRLAGRTAAIIRQNLIFAIGAMAVLVVGSLFFALPLPLAVIGHEGGTLLVVLNGLRLLADPIRRA
ncbi:MAG: cation-translocating P-type ATPase [Paracoccus sp. (in: a-proteobacteria)]|nr:cation-translocating P-type ATPase [Paracoccus sp. (in: a-proteobacteria)]